MWDEAAIWHVARFMVAQFGTEASTVAEFESDKQVINGNGEGYFRWQRIKSAIDSWFLVIRGIGETSH